MNTLRLLLLGGFLLLLALFFYFDLHDSLTLEQLQAQRATLASHVSQHTGLSLVAFAIIYIAVTGLSLPGATIMTLMAGALFGLGVGLVLVSFVSTIGASIAFLFARYLFRDLVQRRFGAVLRRVNEGVQREGAFYLFALRLVPAVPFFAVNLGMGVTPMRLRTFYWVSQLGMLAGTFVYVNAGQQLAQIDTLSGILSPTLIASFVLLGIFPLLARKGLQAFRNRASRSQS